MKTWCIVYRTGGTDNFKWNRSLAYTSRMDAQIRLEAVKRSGHPAYIVDYQQSCRIGLPETFDGLISGRQIAKRHMSLAQFGLMTDTNGRFVVGAFPREGAEMTQRLEDYAQWIIRELVAEADNGLHRETAAVNAARHWLTLYAQDHGGQVVHEDGDHHNNTPGNLRITE